MAGRGQKELEEITIMPVDRVPCRDVKPHWLSRPGDRYMAHPELRVAFIQSVAEPDMIYVVSDEKLPTSVFEAAQIVIEWRAQNGGC